MTLAKRYSPLDVTVPAGTAIAAPQMSDPALGDVWLYKVQVRIPSGHAGFTGFYVANNATPIVPWAPNAAWVNGDNDYFEFDVNDEVSAGLAVATYNTDVIDHTFYFRFVNVPISAVTVPATTPIVAVS